VSPATPGLAQQGGPQPGPAAPAPQFTGEPISLDFQDADLRAVLRVFADVSGLNVVIDPTVQGTVDVALRDVPWDQALDIILRANRLGYSVEGTIVRIAPLTALAQEEAERAALAEQQALAGELGVETVTLSYARAADLAPLLEQTVLSARGSIRTDVRTNTLIISDLAQQLNDARALISTLDVSQAQVEIEARIIQTSRDFAQALGVQWGASGQATAALGNTLPTTFPNELAGTAGVDLGATGATSILGLALGSINGAVGLDVALSALESEGQLRILSTPRVATQNNVQAEIAQGVRVPIQTVANNTVTIQYVDAALTLLVTPQITADDTVIMNIGVDNGSLGQISVGNNPIINTQRANTQVLVRDGETTVIGGIYVSTERSREERTPVLSRIPLLGWLFRNQNVSDESQELLIFITPRISRL
jgi:type IV pilus assembly protein PilQ